MRPPFIHPTSHKPLPLATAGVTLIELLVSISILVILLGIAVPSFQSFLIENRVKSVTIDFMSSLNLARSEAIKRGGRVVICESSNSTASNPTCNSNDWNDGWFVFVDTDNDATHDSTEAVLQVREAISDVAITDNFTTYISFTATGATKATNGAFLAGTVTICSSPSQRQVIINSSGRIQAQKGTC